MTTLDAGTNPFIDTEDGTRHESGDALADHQSDARDRHEQGYVEIETGAGTRRACAYCFHTFPDTDAGNDALADHFTDEHDHFTQCLIDGGAGHE